MAEEVEQQEEQAPGRAAVMLRFGLFFTVILGLFALLHSYIGSRLVAALPSGARELGWGVVWALYGSLLLGLVAFRGRRGPIATPIFWISHLWFGAFGLMLSATVATDLLRLAGERWLGGAGALGLSWAALQTAVIAAAVVPAFLIGLRTARGPARIERINVPVERLGPAFKGVRIVQLSDVHIGDTLDGKFLERVVAQVNALDPDIVAITGDLVDGSVHRIRDQVASLANLKARDGVYYVTGNHEYYHGGPAWEAEVRRLGITVLHNQHKVIRRGDDALVIAGVTDLQAAQFDPRDACDPKAALAGAPAGVPRILLAHQPRAAALAKGLDVALQLSGHTHGGQIFPFMFFVRLQQPVVSGLKKLYGLWVYTSRGTGYWGPPLRVGPAPEISEVTLTF